MNILQPWNTVFFVGLAAYFYIRHVFIKRLDLRNQVKVIRRVDWLERTLLFGVGVAIGQLPLIFLFTPLLSFAEYDLPAYVPLLGTAAMILSLWLFWHSHADLGENWSVSLEIRDGHTLVTEGVYRHVRHPMYASFWLWAIAQGLILQNWLAGWSTIVTFGAMYFLRMPREESMMCERFGEAYRQYMRRTGRLAPRLLRNSPRSGDETRSM